MSVQPIIKVDRKVIVTIARKLQAGHTKETGGEVLKWIDVPADERKLWIRLATRAAKVIQPGL